jgi:hypothetical protein
MSTVTYLQNLHTGETTFKVGDEVENNSIRFFIGTINDSGNLCFVDKEKPWIVKDQTNPMAKCMSQGNFGIASHLLKHTTPPAAPAAQPSHDYDALYAAWLGVGADVKGLHWNDFVSKLKEKNT